MFDVPLFVVVVVSCAIVAIVLMFGIGVFGLGGEKSKKYSNKLMRLRIFTQAIAIGVILLYVWLRQES